MTAQELMLNQNANLNFQYNNKIYKVSININEGLIVVKEIKSNKELNIKSIIDLSNLSTKVIEN